MITQFANTSNVAPETPDSRYVGSDAILMCKTKCMIFENVYVNVQDMMVECWCCPAENQSFLAGPDSYNNIARD